MNGVGFEIIQTIALIIGPGGAVYFGLKGALNGLRRDTQDIKTCAEQVARDVTIIKTRTERLAPPQQE